MQKVTLSILGCGSALPTQKNFPSSQLLEMRDKQFLIDCGEGAQIRLRQMGLKTNRLGHIFISHLHGDHCFGLIGLISSFGMLNRTAELHLHAQADLEKILQPQLNYFCSDLPFKVVFHAINPRKYEVIYEDRSGSYGHCFSESGRGRADGIRSQVSSCWICCSRYKSFDFFFILI